LPPGCESPLHRRVMSLNLPAGYLAPPPTKDIFVQEAPYLPFASLRDGYSAFRRSSVEDSQIGPRSTGILLHTAPTQRVVWWNVNVWAKEVVTTALQTLPTREAVQGNGVQVSALKVRVGFPEFPSRERDILMDIGSGFTISVGPTTRVSVELMVPDQSKFTGIVPPELVGLRTSTYVVASAWPVPAPIGRASGRISRAVYLEPNQTTQLVQIGDGARFVQIFGDSPGGAVSVAPAFLIRESAADRPLGRISFPVAAFNSPRTQIAQNAKFISLVNTLALADTILNVVQELEL